MPVCVRMYAQTHTQDFAIGNHPAVLYFISLPKHSFVAPKPTANTGMSILTAGTHPSLNANKSADVKQKICVNSHAGRFAWKASAVNSKKEKKKEKKKRAARQFQDK